MPDSKISGLTSATTPLAGTEVLPIVQGGQTRQVSVANLTAGRSVDASTLTVTGNTYLATTSGNVGVGATSVTAIYGKTLQIGSGSTESSLSLLGSTGNGFVATTGATFGVFGRGGMALVLGTNDVERARIDTSGNVGIGTSSPTTKLTIDVTSAAPTTVTALTLRNTLDGGIGMNFTNSVSVPLASINALVTSSGAGTDDGILQFSTAANGVNTERMRIDSAGNVGIGTSSPSVPLTVGNSNARILVQPSIGTNGAWTQFNNTGGNAYVGIDSSVGSLNAAYALNIYHAGAYPIVFSTSNAERARIGANGNMAIGSTDTSLGRLNVVGSAASSIPLVLDTNASYGEIQTYGSRPLYLNRQGNDVLANVGGGNFGIATTSPDAKLRVNGAAKIGEGAASNTSKLMVNTVSGVAAGIQLFQDANESWIIQNPASTTALTFANSGTERMRITATGDVGIGTSSPSYKLDIRGSAVGSNFAAISVDNTAAGSGSPANTVSINFSNGGAVKASITGAVYGDGYLAFATNNNTEKVRITAAGDVGIGTGSPAAKLDVVGSLGIRVNEDAAGTKVIQIRSNFAGLGPSIQVSTADPLLFLTSNTERMRITSTGDVGIGTTGPSVKLQVNGTSNGATLELLRLSNIGTGANTKSRLNFYAASTNYGSITGGYGASAPEMVFDINTTAGAYIWNNNATEQMRITSVGNVGIGTSSPSGKLHVYGGAIRTNTRVTNSQNYPLGHYSPGECVFEIDPTWTEAELQAFFNSSAVTWAAVADAPGGYCIYIDGAVNVGGVYNSGFSYIPVDTSDVYYMECWIQNVGSNQGHYMGSVDYNQSFSSLGGNPGSYGYWVMSNTDPGTTWTKVSGYIQGFGTAVSQFVAGTKYWTPMALFNYTAGTGTRACRISGWKVIRAYQPGNRFFSGNVGIGTSSPGAKLDVAGAARVQGDFFVYGTGDRFNVFPQTAGNGVNVVSTNNANSAYAQLTLDGVPLIFKVAGTERMRITSAGDVGIGTSSPGARLNVQIGGSGQATPAALFFSNNDGFTPQSLVGLAIYNNRTSGFLDTNLVFGNSANSYFAIGHHNGTSYAERMRIDASGNLGLGVTPSAWDRPAYQSTQNLALLGLANTSNLAQNAYFNGSWRYMTTAAAAVMQTAQGSFNWFNAPSGTTGTAISFTQAMTLDASGNLGLGVTPQAWNANHRVIELAGASSAHVVAYVNGLSSGTNYYINSGGLPIYSYTGQNATRYFQTVSGQHQWFNAPSGTAGNTISFTQAMTLDASGDFIVGGTTTNGIRLTVEKSNPTRGIIAHVINSGSSGLTGSQLMFTQNTVNNWVVGQPAGVDAFAFWSGRNTAADGTERLRITSAGNIHTPAGATTMTDGFIYIPSAGGTPTGAATAITGTVPLYYDTTNNKLFIYNSSWQNIATAGSLPLLSTNANGVVYLNSSSQATTSSAFVYNSSGYLGVNKTSPAYYLDVTTSSRVTGGMIVTGLTTPTAPSGTGSTTGGTLAAATYYAKVIALDVNTGVTTISAESTGVTTTGSTSSIVWTWTAVTGAVSYQLYFGTTSGTGYNTYFTTATNSYTLTTTAGASTNIFGQPSASAPGSSGTIAADGTIKGSNLQAIGNVPTGGMGALLWNGSNNANAVSNLLFGNDVSFVVSGIYQYPSTATIANEMRMSNGQNAPISLHTNGSERMRITGDGNFLRTQAAHSTVNTSSTLNITQVQSGIIVSTPATNITITLPTGTTLESYTANMPVGFSFELTIILVTGSGGTDITIAANGNTFYPSSGTNVTTNGPSTLRFRKTATNTFSVYRLS